MLAELTAIDEPTDSDDQDVDHPDPEELALLGFLPACVTYIVGHGGIRGVVNIVLKGTPSSR